MIKKKYFIIKRKSDNYIYCDKGRYKDFLDSDEIKNFMFYSDPKKMPSWAKRENEYEIKEVELVLNDL